MTTRFSKLTAWLKVLFTPTCDWCGRAYTNGACGSDECMQLEQDRQLAL